jgi:hypothetical protein
MIKHLLMLLASVVIGTPSFALDLQFEPNGGYCIYQGSYTAEMSLSAEPVQATDNRDQMVFELVSQAVETELEDGTASILKTIGLGSEMQAPKAWSVFYEMGENRFHLAAPDALADALSVVTAINILGSSDIILQNLPTEHKEIIHVKVFRFVSNATTRKQLQELTQLQIELRAATLTAGQRTAIHEKIRLINAELQVDKLKPIGDLSLSIRNCTSREELEKRKQQKLLPPKQLA